MCLSAGLKFVTSTPSIIILPDLTFLRPQTLSMIVVLPEPDLPIKTAYFPFGMLTEIFLRENFPAFMVMSSRLSILHLSFTRS